MTPISDVRMLQEWLDTLQRLQEAPSTRTLYLLGIPTARVPDETHIESYKSRNRVHFCGVLTQTLTYFLNLTQTVPLPYIVPCLDPDPDLAPDPISTLLRYRRVAPAGDGGSRMPMLHNGPHG